MYNDIVGQIVSVAVPENESDDVKLDVERAKQAIGAEIATSSSVCYLRS